MSVGYEIVDSQRGAYPAGGTPLYKLYRYVPPGRVRYLRRFGLKTGIVLPILIWNRDWFSRELRECMSSMNQYVSVISLTDAAHTVMAR